MLKPRKDRTNSPTRLTSTKFLHSTNVGDHYSDFQLNISALDAVVNEIELSGLTPDPKIEIPIVPEVPVPVEEISYAEPTVEEPLPPKKFKLCLSIQYNHIEDVTYPVESFLSNRSRPVVLNGKLVYPAQQHGDNKQEKTTDEIQTELLNNFREWRKTFTAQHSIRQESTF